MRHNSMTMATAGVMLLAAGSAMPVQAQALKAFDNAADPAYNSGWTTGTNGGTGFQPWILSQTNNNNGGFFIGDSNTNGGVTGPGINTSGKAFALYANSGVETTAFRPLTGTLGVGQVISLDFDNGYIDNGGSAGFYLANSTNTGRFTFYFAGGDNQYRYVDSAGTTGTNLGFTDQGLHATFTLTTATTYNFSVTRLSDNTTFSTTGTIAASDIDRIAIFNNNAGSGGQRNVFANNLKAAPAPSALFPMLGGLGAIFGVLRRRKRN